MRTVLGRNWSIKDKKLQTNLEVVLPKSLNVKDGINICGSDEHFNVLVSGLNANDPELPSCFDNTLIFQTKALDNANNMEIAFWDKENARPSLILNQGAPGRASLFERSLIVGAQKGIKSLDGNYTLCDDFPNLSCDTSLYGADLGVENDLEVRGIIYVDKIKESTLGLGVSFNEIKADVLKVDDLTVDNVITDLVTLDDVEVNDSVVIHSLAGGGNRAVKVDNTGNLYAE
jgi:hypothetical protein